MVTLHSSSISTVQLTETKQKIKLGPFESLPGEVLWKIFQSLVRDLGTLSKIQLTSKRLKRAVDGYTEKLLRSFSSIHPFISRVLIKEEKELPLLNQLHITQKIISQKDSKGATHLIRATLQAKISPEALQTMRILILLGADIKQSTSNGWTAEQYAKYWNINGAFSLLKEMANN